MSNKNKIPSIAPLHYKYPSLSAEDMPDKFILFPITFRNGEIEEFEVLFFHRLLKRNYGFLSDWEPEEIKRETIEEGHYYSGHKESNNLHRDIVILRVLPGAELTSQTAFEGNIQPAWQSLKLLMRRYLNSGQGNI